MIREEPARRSVHVVKLSCTPVGLLAECSAAEVGDLSSKLRRAVPGHVLYGINIVRF